MNGGVRRLLAKRTPRLQTLATAGLLVLVIGAAVVLYQQRPPAPLATATGSRPVAAMHFFSQADGWALVLPGALLATRDGGGHWRDITPGPRDSPIRAVLFIDRTHGWAATVGGVNIPLQIFRTTDGGGAWRSSQVEVGPAFEVSLEFVDAQHGWLAVATQTITGLVSSGELFQTGDGGATWNPLPSPPSGHPVRFIDKATGWTVGGSPFNKLYLTQDGGHTWNQQKVPIPPAYADTTPLLLLPTLVDARHGVVGVVFADGSLLLDFTDDGGATWSMDPNRAPLFIRQPSQGRLENVVAPTFVSRDLMAAVVGRELKVQAGGRWTSIRPRGLDSASQIEFVSPRVGWARNSYTVCPGSNDPCDWHSDLMRTTDGGLTWQPVPVR